MSPQPLSLPRVSVPSDLDAHVEATHAERLALLMERELDFVWRSLRRLGVPDAAVDDACQRVWLVLARRLTEIVAGSERAFLFGTARRVASDARRKLARLREAPDGGALDTVDPAPRADEVLDQRQARALLDEILELLPEDLRVVFILYELEEQTAAQIAELLSMPPGTVASRLRRARAEFERIVKRLRARGEIEGSR